jgi:hypothetical protein
MCRRTGRRLRLASVAGLALAVLLAAGVLQERWVLEPPAGVGPDAHRSARAVRTERNLARLERMGSVGVGSPVVLNEVMTANPHVILDEDLAPSDWIELYNRSQHAVSLAGWSLADGLRARRRWILPNVSLEPGEHLVVWASGKDRAGGSVARTLGFALEPWAEEERDIPVRPERIIERSGPGGPVHRVRVALTLPEDGLWEPWLVARAQGDTPARLAVRVDGELVAEPVLNPSGRRRHIRLAARPRAAGERVLELEAREESVELVRISWVQVGDDGRPRDLHLHTSFRLARSGETVVLLDARGRAMDHVTPPAFHPGLSYQRMPDGAEGFRFAIPTPGGRDFVVAPDLGTAPSLAAEPFHLHVETPAGVEALRYTLDGSIPDAASPRLDAPLLVARPTVLRVRGFTGEDPLTAVATRQFWVGAVPEAAVAMVALDPLGLYDPEVGIIANNAGRGKAWERVAHVLLFDAAGIVLEGYTGLRTHAGRGFDKGRNNSFQLRCRSSHGPGRFQAHLFEPHLAPFSNRVIFDAMAVTWADKLAYDMASAAGGAAPRTRGGVLYLNGRLHNRVVMVESVAGGFLLSRWGHRAFDLIKGKPFEAKRGSFSRLHALAERLEEPGWTADDVRAELDLPGILALHFARLFADTTQGGLYVRDTVQGYMALERRPGGRLRAIGWDLDHGFRVMGHDTLAELHAFVPERPWASRFLAERVVQQLFDTDPAFRREYRLAAERFLDEVVAQPRWLAEIDAFERLELRYGRPRTAVGAEWLALEEDPEALAERLLGYHDEARERFALMRRFFRERPDEMRGFIAAALAKAEESAFGSAGRDVAH